MKTELDEEWKNWIRVNVERGCSRDELYRILIDEGFADGTVEAALQHKPDVDISRIANPLRANPLRAGPEAVAPRNDGTAAALARLPGLKRFDSPRIELYTAEGFLDAAECRRVVKTMQGRLRESTITAPGEPDKYFRVSRTCDLGCLDDASVRQVDRKICAALGMAEAWAEPTQGQHYDPGGEFKAHTDYFEQYELTNFSTPTLGQRSWTFMVYLNEPEAGGETAFVNVGLVVKPRLGMAVIWSNLLPDGRPNPDTLHHGMPVRSGHKDIITKWFRAPARR
jgi:prolyl 4-hydroxylase